MIGQFLDRYRHKRKSKHIGAIPSVLEAMHEVSIAEQKRKAESFKAAHEHLERLIHDANIHESLKGADPHINAKHKRT